MKHKIEIVPNLAIYIDGERVIGSKPYGMFLTTTMIVSDDDLKRLVDRCLEVIADCKTEDSSEKSNNCETCRHYKLACELFSEICKYEPKDEPLTADYCDTCDHKECEYCIADSSNPYCVPSNYHKVEDESTISKMEQVDEPTGYNLSPVEDESQTADVYTWDGKVGEIEIHNILYEPTYNEDDGSM